MAKINEAPYYDDFDSAKQYTQLLALPGRVAQAREFTQMQSTMKNIMKGIGDSLMKDGDIIEGCQVLVNSDKTAVTITAGKIYLHGMVLPVTGTEEDGSTIVSITGLGTEVIGAKLVENIITEAEDTSLRDPALGVDNYDQPGCHRLQSKVVITVNDAEAAILATLSDGELTVENMAPEYDTLTRTLARRTFDESGSYIVNGLRVGVEAIEDEDDYYNVVVESGKAYVLGYELKVPTARHIRVESSKNNVSEDISRNYSTGSSEYVLYSTHPYVESITSVTGVVQETTQLTMTVNGVQLSDASEVLSITQGGTTYVSGTDYTVQGEGSDTLIITWININNLPSGSVTVTYTKPVTFSSTDYQLIINSNGGHSIKWVGTTPLNNTTFIVHIDTYLARRDIVYMDEYGTITVLTGTPAKFNKVTTPEPPTNALILAYIYNPPNGVPLPDENNPDANELIEVVNVGLVRFTMNDIQRIVDRVQTIEYDQALISLNNEAINDITSGKKGIYTDPLIDLSRIDFYKEISSSTVNPYESNNKSLFDMAVDLMSNICYLPVYTKTTDLSYNSTGSSSVKKNARLVTLSYSSDNVTLLEQVNATSSFSVNPYSVYPDSPEITIDPASDSWIDDEYIYVPISVERSSVVKATAQNIDNRTSRQINNRNYSSSSKISVVDTVIGTKTSVTTVDNVISTSAAEYIRPREITVEGNNFNMGGVGTATPIICTFDGKPMELTLIDGSPNSLPNSGVTTVSGHFKAKFTIPQGIRCGIREVKVTSASPINGHTLEAFTTYVAEGTNRQIQRTVTTVNTVLLQRTTTTTVTAVYVDPVGQTFVLNGMSMISGIELYFAARPGSSTVPITLEIREVVNGLITSQIYARKSLYSTGTSSGVRHSSDATVPTVFKFDDPVILEGNKEYAFTLRSQSNAYRLWVATMGEPTISTANTANPVLVSKNPYLTGVMMSSSNNSSWTIHQTSDLKFKILGYDFTYNGTVKFSQVSLSQFSRVLLLADSIIPDGTAINWEYKTNQMATYEPITPNEMVLSDKITNTKLDVRAQISTTTNRLSPIISLDTVTAITSCYKSVGLYVMKEITGVPSFTNVKVILDVYGDQSAFHLYSLTGNDVVTSMTLSPTVNRLDYDWFELTYTATVTSAQNFRLLIKLISANSITRVARTPAFRRLRVILS